MAVFRVERNTGYTVMSNHHLRNKELSLKAKGLLSQMLSLPEDWDYTLAGLSYINRESIDAIRTAVWELEKAGYITRRQGRDEKGKMTAIEYTIYEQPQPPELDCPVLENPTADNPTTENPTSENPMQLNKDISRTNLQKKEKSNTDLSSTHSIPIHSLNPLPYGEDEAAQPPERKGTERNDAYRVYEEIIKDNIEYNILLQDMKFDHDRLNEIVDIILETVCTSRKKIRIAGDDYPAELVKSKFMKLDSEHIRFVLDCMQENTTKIRNIKQYLKAVLFNKKTIANYINPYIGGVALNQLTPAMVDKMFQQIIDKGLKPSTAAGAKRVLSVALSHARKYRYIETNAAKDTLTKFGKGDKTPDPYTPEQVKALMQRVEGTVWEMPVILGGLYGMRRSEILGLRWRNVDLENNTFDVTEQLPFKVPPKTKVIEEMAPPKSNGRKLPITELARPFFLKQLAMQEVQKEQAAKDGKPYYDNDLVVAKPDGAPIAASWVSSQFGKLLEDLDMPHIRFHDLRHTAATNMHQLTGDFYTVGEVLGHTLAGIGASLGLSMNFEAVTARYVDVRLERKKEVLDAYHSAVEKAAPEKPKEAEPKKGKRAAKKKHSEIDL